MQRRSTKHGDGSGDTVSQVIDVLLVEDNPGDARLIRELLDEASGARFRMTHVSRLKEALERLAGQSSDVALLDLNLPDSRGLESAQRLHDMAPDVPVVVLTGIEDEALALRAVQLGAQDFLVKGYLDGNLLARSIAYAIERHELLTQQSEYVRELEANETALRESQRFLQSTLNALSSHVAILDASGGIIAVNAAWRHSNGDHPLMGSELQVGRNYVELCMKASRSLGDAAAQLAAGVQEVAHGQRDELQLEYPFAELRRWFSVRVTRFKDGARTRMVVAHEDVTARRRLEGQLQQAQRMEAVGRLAGGVAHDFNNLLLAITGYSNLLLNALPRKAPYRSEVEEIRRAAERAAALTQQLLAFSRRQVLEPVVLDLNAVVADMERMLRRLIGEHVELDITLDPRLGRVRADRGQIEQVIMNLALNARDVMLQGGRMKIATYNTEVTEDEAEEDVDLEPGSHTVLEVSDTGAGMDPSTLPHIFEPFFTTKEQGKGTGLGLATVYGIVKQSGGHIVVESESGSGSTFRILLPRCDEPAPKPQHDRMPPELGVDEMPRGSETILLVEDEEVVRVMLRDVLRRQGYQVLEARDGAEALRLALDYDGRIDLLLTDVVMPRMSGHDLAQRLGPLRPDMRIMYMSGYTSSVLARGSLPDRGGNFLQKPFSPRDLAFKLREALADPAGRSA